MAFANTPNAYGSLARAFHWLTALLVFTAIGLALYADNLPDGSDAEAARLALVYSLHKTIGVATFAVALARILWVVAQPKPGALHPERRFETFVAAAVHWSLYTALLVMPLSGWLHHAASTGFAPIWWPFGQSLPFVPKSPDLADVFRSIHGAASKLLFLSIALHLAGALKHAVIDRDGTVARMTRGTALPTPAKLPSARPMLAALTAWTTIVALGALTAPAPRPEATPAVTGATAGGNWTVTHGTLGFSVKQMAATVTGDFTGWTAEISYDDAARAGAVTVTIPLSGMTTGSVTPQAAGPEFFDVAAHPTAIFKAAIFKAAIAGADRQLAATGSLSLRGKAVPVTLPFTLTIDGDTATMTGQTTLDRRDFGMGPSYPDERTVGFKVIVDVALTAQRK